MKLKKLLFLILLFGLFIRFYANNDSSETINQNKLIHSDTSYYHAYIGIERSVTEEFVKTYSINGKIHADINARKYQSYSYVGKPTLIHMLDSFEYKSIQLTKSQIDTLDNFLSMIKNKNVRHNQGIKIAGRIGIYKTIIQGDTTEFKSRELYRLLNALGYDKE